VNTHFTIDEIQIDLVGIAKIADRGNLPSFLRTSARHCQSWFTNAGDAHKGSVDPVSPIAGDGTTNALPFADLENFWQTANATKGTTTQTLLNGHVTEHLHWGAAQTTAYVVAAMGRQWPIAADGKDYTPSGIHVGPPCPSPVNLNSSIIEFLNANHR
jgi:hypothetical protein